MKPSLKLAASLICIGLIYSCSKNENSSQHVPPPPPSPPPTVIIPCDGRPVISARLVSIGSLSEGRRGLVSATAGNKILFAGGINANGIALSSRVDIYDTSAKTWSTAALTDPDRYGMATATVGNKIFFAGGSKYDFIDEDDWGEKTSRIDIYDAANNTWSTAELSKPRNRLAAATIGNKIFFAGGKTAAPGREPCDVVDIYDNITNTWTTATLSEGRFDLSATVFGNKIYFSGGFKSNNGVSKVIDIFDAATNTWSISQLLEPRASHVSISGGNKIFWAGGIYSQYPNSQTTQQYDNVEIKDMTIGESDLYCFIPKSFSSAVIRNDNIIFFTGRFNNNRYLNYHIDIYNIANDQWSIGELDRTINDAAIISVNNTIYIAGGLDQSWGLPYLKDVWRLEF